MSYLFNICFFLRLYFLKLNLVFSIILYSTFAAFAQSFPFEVNVPTISGSFLAGEQAYEDLRTKEAASFFLDAAESDWENPMAVEKALSALVLDGRVEDGAAIAQHLIEMQPQNAIARLVLGTVALKERRYSSAISQFNKVPKSDFIGIAAIILNSWALVGEKKFATSQNLLDSLDRAGLADFVTFHRALMADVEGNRDLALFYSKKAYEIDPFVSRTIEARVRILANSLQFKQAQKLLKTYNDNGFSHPILDDIAKSIAKKQRPGKIANNVQSGAAELYHAIGTSLGREREISSSYLFFRLGQYLDQKNEVIIFSLAQTLENVSLYEQANEFYATIPNTSVLSSLAMINIAQNLNTLGDNEAAIRKLTNITVLEPDNLKAISALGDMLRVEKLYDEAIIAYSKALKISGLNSPSSWKLYYVRAISYERSDRWELAEKDFLKSLELNPSQPQVLNYLGYSWVDKNMNLEEGLKLIKEAVEGSPYDGYIVDSLGWAYYRLNRFDEAVVELERAVNLSPNDAEINDHLGDAYWKVGRKLEARYQWKIAIDVDKDGVVTKRTKPKLENGLD